MVDNPTNLDDGEGRYASRSRINRKVIVFTSTELGGNSTASISTQINGKLGRMVIDASRCATTGASATQGSVDLTMDLQQDDNSEYKFCDTIAGLNFTATANTAQHFQMSEGSNQGVTGSDNALHFSRTAQPIRHREALQLTSLPHGMASLRAMSTSQSPSPQALGMPIRAI